MKSNSSHPRPRRRAAAAKAKAKSRKATEPTCPFKLGQVVRWYDDGWFHGRLIKWGNTTALVEYLGSGHRRRIPHDKVDAPLWT